MRREVSTAGTDGRAELTARITAAEARLHAAAMRLVPPLPVPADLTLRQLQVLAILRQAPGSTGQDLAELMGVSTPTVSGLVDRVASKGWVDRRQDPEDRRRVLLRLTPEAETMLAELEAPPLAVRSRLLARLDDGELAALARLVDRMHEEMQALAGEQARPLDTT